MIIDLTQSSPIGERGSENRPALKTTKTTMPSTLSTRRSPRREGLNDVRASTRAQASARPILPVALIDAIDTVDEKLLRTLVKQYCETLAPLRQKIEDQLLVKGHDIVRYESSDEDKSIDKDGEESDDEVKEDSKKESEMGVIPVADGELTSRYATCLNCEAKFDITQNYRGDCRWHTGMESHRLARDFENKC